jgi:PAS domain S-box-containing protein
LSPQGCIACVEDRAVTDDPARAWERAGTLCALGAATIALLVVGGWFTDSDELVTVASGLAATKLNTAIAVLLSAGALLMPRARIALSVAAAAIGAATLLERFVGGLGIDQLLVADPGPATGRPAPHTAICLLAVGLAIAGGRRQRVRTAALSAAMLALLFGAVGYAYRVQPLTGPHTGMGPITLLVLGLLVAAIAAGQPSAWPLSHLRGTGPANAMARRLTVAIATVPLAGLVTVELERRGVVQDGVELALFVVCIVGLFQGVVAITVGTLTRLEITDRHLRDVLAAAPDAIIVATRDGEIVVANEEALRMFGYGRDELIGRAVTDVLTGAWPSAGNGVERFARRRDGLELPVEISLGPLDTAEGGLVTAVIRDITERRVDEERLMAAAQFFEISYDLLCTIDAAGYFVELNGAWEQTLGWTPSELRDRRSEELVHPADRRRTGAAYRRKDGGHETDRLLNRVRTRDGGWRWLEWTTVSPPGDWLTYASARDVTERVEAEHELAVARDEALAAARTKSAFLANMSHEIRTPLNGVLGITNVLLDGELSPEQRSYAELIQRSGDTLLTVVNDVLDVSKIEAGALELEDVPFTLLDATEDAFDLTGEQAASKGLKLTMSVGHDLPAIVVGDPVRLRQVLGNLLSNAVKFTAEGEITLTLSTAGEDDAGRTLVRFEVSDEGIGIEPGHVSRMFEPFTQADVSTTRRFGGSGLGLAIVSQLVQMMGGQVGANSTPGEGSTFWFTVPFEVASVGVPTPQRDVRAPTAGARVLVVEDNEVNRIVAVELLERRGCSVTTACEGREGLAALERECFDVVLMDCQMPEVDGYEATRRLRASGGPAAQTPVVAMTAHALPEDRARCLDAGMDDYLAKPIGSEDLDRVLARFAPPSAPSVDEAVAAELRSRLPDPAVRAELVDLFCEQATEIVATLRTGVAAGDAPGIAAAAHKLKGTCLTLAAAPLVELCSRLDDQAKTGALQGVGALVDEIAAACAPTEAALRAALASD